MAKDRSNTDDYTRPLRRLLLGLLVLVLFAVFLLWRIDSPRVERLRANVVDRVVPNMDWAMKPVTGTVNLARDFQSYQRLAEQNQDLRDELRKMQRWQEAAVQLEQENARLLDLNNVRLDPRLTVITGVVMADSGTTFRQSVLLNVGADDGIVDGWATMDGLGLVGRIAGVGQRTSRVILLTDASSRIPATVQPSGQGTIVAGDNSRAPLIEFIENPEAVRPGDRVVSSGDGGVFPAGLLIGRIARDPGGRLRVRPSADFERLKYLRVLRHHGTEQLNDPIGVIGPAPEIPAPIAEPDATQATDTPQASNG